MNCLVTVVICTRNRAGSLRETVVSVAECAALSAHAIELLVVDNGSTDATGDVVRSMEGIYPIVRYISEATPGQCYARNRGLREARGDMIIFTDDDVRVPFGWIDNMCLPIVNEQADMTIGGFRTVHANSHYVTKAGQTMPNSGLGDSSFLLGQEMPTPIGLNFAFRRRVLAAVDGFDLQLGPGALGFADDTLFGLRVRAAGFRLIVVESVRVEHHMDPERFSPQAILSSAQAGGRSAAYLDYHWWHKGYARFRVSARLLKLRLAQIREHVCFIFRRDEYQDLSRRASLRYEVAYWSQIVKELQFPRKYTQLHRTAVLSDAVEKQ